jgi:hypothetical protein
MDTVNMNLQVFKLNPQGLLELVSEPVVDDEDDRVFPIVLPLDEAA